MCVHTEFPASECEFRQRIYTPPWSRWKESRGVTWCSVFLVYFPRLDFRCRLIFVWLLHSLLRIFILPLSAESFPLQMWHRSVWALHIGPSSQTARHFSFPWASLFLFFLSIFFIIGLWLPFFGWVESRLFEKVLRIPRSEGKNVKIKFIFFDIASLCWHSQIELTWQYFD